MALLDDLDRRRERELRDRENSARLAMAYATFSTVGSGSIQNGDRISFETTFIEMPYMSYGAVIDVEQVMDEFGYDPEFVESSGSGNPQENVPLPLCTGYVTEWDQDERGFYIGCWVAVRVYYPGEELASVTDPQIEIDHHFSFAANAMKDIPMSQDPSGDLA